MGSEACQLAMDLLRYGFAQVGTHTSSSAISKAKHLRPSFLKRKFNMRELDLPFDTGPSTTRESTGTRSLREYMPPGPVRLRRPVRLSICSMCFALRNRSEKVATQWSSIASVAAAPCESRISLGGLDSCRSGRTCSTLSSATA